MKPKQVDWTVAVWLLLVLNDVVQSLKSTFKERATVKTQLLQKQAHTPTKTLPARGQFRSPQRPMSGRTSPTLPASPALLAIVLDVSLGPYTVRNCVGRQYRAVHC